MTCPYCGDPDCRQHDHLPASDPNRADPVAYAAMHEPRYVVTEIGGYAIDGGPGNASLELYILDTWNCHRVVARFDGTGTPRLHGLKDRRDHVRRRCETMNDTNAALVREAMPAREGTGS